MSSRLNEREAEELLLHGDPVELGRRADAERRKRFDDTVTFIVDRNINYTNVCVNECRFCAFFRRKESRDAYLLTYDEILEKVRETVEAGGTQVMIQGGLYPDLGLEYYEKMRAEVAALFPGCMENRMLMEKDKKLLRTVFEPVTKERLEELLLEYARS